MAKASKKHMGVGSSGKGPGSGTTAPIPNDKIGDNMVLSNRDKSRHSRERGLDGKEIQNEQLQDHAANRIDDGKV